MSSQSFFIHFVIGVSRRSTGRERLGAVKVGGEKYTRWRMQMTVVAEDEGGLKGMIKGLEKYMDGKVNVKKSKVMRCRRGGGRWKKVIWKWKGREIEEV